MGESFTTVLEDEIRTHTPLLARAWNQLFARADARERFIDMLRETFFYARHSSPLIELAAFHLDERHLRIRNYLHLLAVERQGSHQWVQADLSELGFGPEKIKGAFPLRETLALVGSQYYVIQELHPVGHLGSLFALDSLPPSLETIQHLSQELDLPLSSLSCLVGMAEADPSNTRLLNSLLNHSSLNPRDQELIIYSARMTVCNLSDVIRRIAAS